MDEDFPLEIFPDKFDQPAFFWQKRPLGAKICGHTELFLSELHVVRKKTGQRRWSSSSMSAVSLPAFDDLHSRHC